jgi:hypothetical protein
MSTHKVVQKYVNLPWKIPSTFTIAYLVKEILKSASANNDKSDQWQTTEFHKNTV